MSDQRANDQSSPPLTGRRCLGVSSRGACRMPPLADSAFCWNHSPAHAAARAEARKLGGRRRKRVSLDGIPADVPLRTVDDVLCLLERAARDTLTLDNGNDRNRTLASIAGQALTALEKGSFEDRLAALEASAGFTRKRAG